MSIRLAPIAIGAQRLHLAETSGQVLGKNLSATIGQIATNLEPSDDGWELTIPGQVWPGEDASIDVTLTAIDAAASASAPVMIPTRPRIDASFASVDSGLALEGSFPDPVAVTVDGVLVESTRASDRQLTVSASALSSLRGSHTVRVKDAAGRAAEATIDIS